MAYTPIPVILDRMLSAGREYEAEQYEIARLSEVTTGQQERKRRYDRLTVAQQRIRAQYKLVK